MKKIYVSLLTIATLTYGADGLSNKRKREATASRRETRRRIDQANTSGNEELSEQQNNIVRMLKAHSRLFKQLAEDAKCSDKDIYNAIMIHQSIYPREGAVEDDRECELTEEGVIDLLRELARKFNWEELSEREVDNEIMNSLESLEDDREDDAIVHVPSIDLESMVHILLEAEDDSEEALINSCNAYVQGLSGAADKGEQIVSLLKAANYLDLPCMLDACARHAASYYANYPTLNQFFKAPKVFEDKINIAPELQHLIVEHLLQKYEGELRYPQLEQEQRNDHDVYSVCFNHDGNRLASGAFNNRGVCICNPATGQLLQTIGRDSSVQAVAYSHDGTRLASGSDTTVRIWDAQTGKQLLQLDHDSAVFTVAFNHNSTQLASGTEYGTVSIWDAVTGQLLLQPDHHDAAPVHQVAFNHNGFQLASGSDNGSVVISDLLTGELLQILIHDGDDNYEVTSIAYNHDDSQLASGGPSGIIYIWNPVTGERLKRFNHLKQQLYIDDAEDDLDGDSGFVNVAYNHNGSQLVSVALLSDKACIWNPATGQLQHVFDSRGGAHVAYNHNGSRLVLGSDKGISIWKIPDYHQLIRSLDLVQALDVYSKLSKKQYDVPDAVGEQYFKELHDSLPDTIKRILDKDEEDD